MKRPIRFLLFPLLAALFFFGWILYTVGNMKVKKQAEQQNQIQFLLEPLEEEIVDAGGK